MNLAAQLRHIFVATADATGTPHIAAAGELTSSTKGRLLVKAWFCPGTMANIQINRRVALVVWDPGTDTGYQVLGETEKIEDMAMLNGYAPSVESKHPVPQVERQLSVTVNKIIGFSHAPHSDIEE